MTKKAKTQMSASGKPFVVESQDPVAKVLWQKTFHQQVKPSHKMYDRKKQKLQTMKILRES